MIYALIGVFIAGFGSGMIISDKYHDAIAAEQIKKHSEQVTSYREKLRKLQVNYLELEQNQKVIRKEVIKYVPKYITKIQKSSKCNLTNGAVRLLNLSINSGRERDTSKTTKTNTQTSNVKASDLIGWSTESIAQYNDMARQCNELIYSVKLLRINNGR